MMCMKYEVYYEVWMKRTAWANMEWISSHTNLDSNQLALAIWSSIGGSLRSNRSGHVPFKSTKCLIISFWYTYFVRDYARAKDNHSSLERCASTACAASFTHLPHHPYFLLRISVFALSHSIGRDAANLIMANKRQKHAHHCALRFISNHIVFDFAAIPTVSDIHAPTFGAQIEQSEFAFYSLCSIVGFLHLWQLCVYCHKCVFLRSRIRVSANRKNI